jgi:molybdopterin-guanine dinucleotide biosynthesis protein A
VLAGGFSRRMGGVPKGLEVVGEHRIIDRVADAIRSVTPRLVLAANESAAIDWLAGVAVLPDELRGAGGLAGVHAALALESDVLVVAWDMPFVSGTLLSALLSHATATRPAAVVPETDSRFGIEPFCAWYGAAARAPIEDFLRRGGGPAREFVASLPGAERLPLRQVRQAGDPERLFFSVNTADDLTRARAMAETAQ